ncbi:hypothetical protein [Cellulomonas cellasea]|uniref:Uncharacterized protein n=1 Tax=Cellulomonas cellasea TaxID=43670 RepID=A0A7W4UDG2_9CELL|nr:hypothetical protein [Cellulomonas cellasea]MBB2921814.1 hypothetical protein [Cellulomonas cellasea]
MTHPPSTPWSELVVPLQPPPEGRVEPVHPALAVRVTTRLHDGSTATLDVELVARSPGLVRVAQPWTEGRPWLAWIPEAAVQEPDRGATHHDTAPDAADLPQPRPPSE